MNHKGIIWNLTVAYSASILGFVIIFGLASVLEPVEFGLIATGIAFGRVLSNVVEIGSQRTFVRAAVRLVGQQTITQLAIENYSIRLVMFAACAVVVSVYAFIVFNTTTNSFGMIFAALWAMLFGLYPSSWFDYSRQTIKQNVYTLIERLASFVILLGLLTLPNDKIPALTAVIPLFFVRLISVFSQARVWMKIHEGGDESPVFQKALNWSSNTTSYFVMAAMVGNSMLTYGNQVLLSSTDYVSQLPAYSLAFQLIGLVIMFQGMVVRLQLRKISEICASGIRIGGSLFRNSAYVLVTSILLGVAILALTEIALIKMLDGVAYRLLPTYVGYLAIWAIIAGLGRIVTQYMIELNRESDYFSTSIMGGLLAFGLGIVFIPEAGAIGVVAILLISHTLMIGRNTLVVVSTIKTESGHTP